MSRYVIWTDDDNLEVFVGFDEGMEGFFLTVADARSCTGETGSYLFHNVDHHPKPPMTLEEVTATLARCGLTLPHDLLQQLVSDGEGCRTGPAGNANEVSARPIISKTTSVLGWQKAD